MKKIISSILAASFIFATCAINVMAAPTTRTISIKTTPETELKVGDTVTVTVELDTALNLGSANYTIKYDPAVFSIDTDKTSRLENFIDATWYNAIKDTDGDFAYFMGAPTKTYNTTEGTIGIGWLGDVTSGSGVGTDSDATKIIGKYNLSVVAVPESGSSDITFTKASLGSYMENTGDTVTTVPATVKFASAEPTATPWEVTITDGSQYANGYIWKADTVKGDGNLTKFDVTFTDSESNTLTRSILSSDKSGTFDWNTATTFYVGLKTARTGVTAAWDIAAKDGEKDVPVTLK